MRINPQYINFSLCFLVLFFIVVSFQDSKEDVVTFDYVKAKQDFIFQLARYNLTDAQIQAKTDAFKLNLAKTLATYAKQHHYIILNKGEVHGGQDLTEQILPLLALKMREGA